MNMLAAATDGPSPQALSDWLAVAFYLVGGAAAIVGLVKMLRSAPSETALVDQPVEVRAHPGIASREDLKQVHGRIDRERREIESEIKRVEIAAEKRADRLEHKVDHTGSAVAEMSGEIKHLNQAVNSLSAAIQNFLRDRANDPR